MRKYKVIIEESAQSDVQDSYDWGCRVWGKARAQNWGRNLRAAITKRLAATPRAFPRAPESDAFGNDIRHMNIDRYRVLFAVEGKRVHVLHVRGPYVGDIRSNAASDDSSLR